MSRSDRHQTASSVALASFCVAALIGVASLLYTAGLLNGRETERRHARPAKYSSAAKGYAQRVCIGTEPAQIFDCVYDIVADSREQAQVEQDLSAQQRAASAALWSTIVAGITLAVSIVGVWFVKRTLDATLQAVKDTGEATSAMRDQNKLTEIAMRPWIKLTIEIGDDLKFVNGKIDFRYRYKIENIGKLPAFDVQVYSSVFLNDDEGNQPIELDVICNRHMEMQFVHRGTTLLPGDTYDGWQRSVIDLVPPKNSSFFQKTGLIFPMIGASAIYEAASGDRHQTGIGYWVFADNQFYHIPPGVDVPRSRLCLRRFEGGVAT